MRKTRGSDYWRHRSASPLAAGLMIVAASITLAVAAQAAEPALTIWIDGEPEWTYALESVEYMSLGSETLEVATESRTDSYPIESITRLGFDLDEWAWVPGDGSVAAIANAVRLFQNRPNPFSPQTRIAFELHHDADVELRVYSVSGRLVRTLVDGPRAAGPHDVVWNGLDDYGHQVASGVYVYSLAAPSESECRKMLLLR